MERKYLFVLFQMGMSAVFISGCIGDWVFVADDMEADGLRLSFLSPRIPESVLILGDNQTSLPPYFLTRVSNTSLWMYDVMEGTNMVERRNYGMATGTLAPSNPYLYLSLIPPEDQDVPSMQVLITGNRSSSTEHMRDCSAHLEATDGTRQPLVRLKSTSIHLDLEEGLSVFTISASCNITSGPRLYTLQTGGQSSIDDLDNFQSSVATGDWIIGVTSGDWCGDYVTEVTSYLRDTWNINIIADALCGPLSFAARVGETGTASYTSELSGSSYAILASSLESNIDVSGTPLGLHTGDVSMAQIVTSSEHFPRIRLFSAPLGYTPDPLGTAGPPWVRVDMILSHVLTGVVAGRTDGGPGGEHQLQLRYADTWYGTWTLYPDTVNVTFAIANVTAKKINPPAIGRYFQFTATTETFPFQLEILGYPEDVGTISTPNSSLPNGQAANGDMAEYDTSVPYFSDMHAGILLHSLHLVTGLTIEGSSAENTLEDQAASWDALQLPFNVFYAFYGRDTALQVAQSMLNLVNVSMGKAVYQVSPVMKTDLLIITGKNISSSATVYCYNITLHGTQSAACPGDGVPFHGKCYYIPRHFLPNVTLARKACREYSWSRDSGHPIRPSSYEEINLIYEFMKAESGLSNVVITTDGYWNSTSGSYIYDGVTSSDAECMVINEGAVTSHVACPDAYPANYLSMCESTAAEPHNLECDLDWFLTTDAGFSSQDGAVLHLYDVTYQRCMSVCQEKMNTLPCASFDYDRTLQSCSIFSVNNHEDEGTNFQSEGTLPGVTHTEMICYGEKRCNGRLLQANPTNITVSHEGDSVNYTELLIIKSGVGFIFLDYNTSLKIEFQSSVKVSAFIVSGPRNASVTPVSGFTVFYFHLTLNAYIQVRDRSGSPKVFRGTEATYPNQKIIQHLPDEIVTTGITIFNVEGLGLTLDILGCYSDGSQDPFSYAKLGMEDGHIGSSQLSASSEMVSSATMLTHTTDSARLGTKLSSVLLIMDSWVPEELPGWLQVDLILLHQLAALIVDHSSENYTTSLSIHYSQDLSIWEPLRETEGEELIITLPITEGSATLVPIPEITTRAVRFFPIGYKGLPALKVDILGQVQGCSFLDANAEDPNLIPDVTLSSSLNTNDTDVTELFMSSVSTAVSGWCFLSSGSDMWITVDLKVMYHVTGVIVSRSSNAGQQISDKMALSLQYKPNDAGDFVSYVDPFSLSEIMDADLSGNVSFYRHLNVRVMKILLITWPWRNVCFRLGISACRALPCPPMTVHQEDKCYFHMHGLSYAPRTLETSPCFHYFGWAGDGLPGSFASLNGYDIITGITHKTMKTQRNSGFEETFNKARTNTDYVWIASTGKFMSISDGSRHSSKYPMNNGPSGEGACLVANRPFVQMRREYCDEEGRMIVCEAKAADSDFSERDAFLWLNTRSWTAVGIPAAETLTLRRSDCLSLCQSYPWCRAATGNDTDGSCRLLNTTILTSPSSPELEYHKLEAFYSEKYITDPVCHDLVMSTSDQFTGNGRKHGYGYTGVILDTSIDSFKNEVYWVPSRSYLYLPYWIQIELGSRWNLRILRLQNGFIGSNQEVHSTKIHMLHNDGSPHWNVLSTTSGDIMNFANILHPVTLWSQIALPPDTFADTVRFEILELSGQPSSTVCVLQAQFYGCVSTEEGRYDDINALGTANGGIYQEQFTKGVGFNHTLSETDFILDFMFNEPSMDSDIMPWIMIDLIVLHDVKGISTVGDPFIKFTIKYKDETDNWADHIKKNTSHVEVFSGSYLDDVAVYHPVEPAIVTTCIMMEFYPVNQSSFHVSFELYGSAKASDLQILEVKEGQLVDPASIGGCTRSTCWLEDAASQEMKVNLTLTGIGALSGVTIATQVPGYADDITVLTGMPPLTGNEFTLSMAHVECDVTTCRSVYSLPYSTRARVLEIHLQTVNITSAEFIIHGILQKEDGDDCKMDEADPGYMGQMNISASGKQCLPWADMTGSDGVNCTLLPGGSCEGAGTHCRNPDHSPAGPWCYVRTITGITSETCYLPICPDDPIRNATVDVIPVLLGEETIFNITYQTGRNVEYQISYGDGNNDTWSDVTDTDYPISILKGYNYSLNGVYDVELFLWNSVSNATILVEVIIELNLTEVLNTTILTHQNKQEPETIQIVISSVDASLNPFAFNCRFDFGDGEESVDIYDIDSTLIYAYGYSHDILRAQVTMTCNNLLTVELYQQEVVLEQEVGEVQFLNPEALAAYEPVPLLLQVTSGTNLQYDVVINDGARYRNADIERLSFTSPHGLTHTFPEPGVYYVFVNASNSVSSTFNETYIIAQGEIHDLDIEASRYVPYPDGRQFFRSVVNTDLPFPDNVTCNWTLGNSNIVNEELIPELSKRGKYGLSIGPFPNKPRNIRTLKISCENLVSRDEAMFDFYVLEVVDGISLSSQVIYVILGDDVKVNVSVTSGALATLTITDVNDSASLSLHEEEHPDDFAHPNPWVVSKDLGLGVGQHTLNITVHNNVSSQSITCDVIVQHSLSGIEILSNDTIVLPPGGDLIVRTLDGTTYTDITCVWYIGPDEFEKTYSTFDGSHPGVLTYDMLGGDVGHTEITVNCSNFVSWASANSSTTILLDKVSVLEFNTTEMVYITNTTEFLVVFDNLAYETCVEITANGSLVIANYGRSEDCIIGSNDTAFERITKDNTTLSFNYSFLLSGVYDVELYTYNLVSNVTIRRHVSVLDWRCDKPRVSLEDDISQSESPREFYLSVPLIIKPYLEDYTCWKEHNITHLWRVGHNDTGVVVASFNTTGSSALDLTRALPPGEYTILLSSILHGQGVRHESDPGHQYGEPFWLESEQAQGYINVGPTPLVVYISGGPVSGAKYGDVVVLDAENKTHDPDAPHVRSASFAYRWTCGYKDQESSLVCSDILTPLSPGRRQLDTSLLVVGTVYTFLVTVTQGGRTGEYMQEFTVGETQPPSVSIYCRSNCDVRQAKAKEIVFGSECESDCGPQTNYLWELFKKSNRTNEEKLENLDRFTKHGTNVSSLYLTRNVLDPGTFYRLVLLAWNTGSAVVSADYTFMVNKPPYGGNCSSDKNIGQAADTLFTPYCLGMRDWLPPHADTRLTYQHWACAATPEQCRDPLLLYSGEEPTMPEMLLPVGDPDNNYTLTIITLVIDSYDDRTAFITELQVFPPNSSAGDTLATLNDMMSGNGSIIMDCLNSGDKMSGLAMLGAVVSVLNSLDTSQGNDAKSSSIKMRSDIVELVSSIEFESESSVQQTSALLSSVMKSADEITVSSQTNIMSAAEDMSSYLDRIAANASLSEYVSMVDGIANIAGGLLSIASGASTNGCNGSYELSCRNKSDQAKEVLRGTHGVLLGVQDLYLNKVEIGDPEVTVDLGPVSMAMGKTQSWALNASTTSSNIGKIGFSISDKTDSACLTNKVLFSEINPYLTNQREMNEVPIISYDISDCSNNGMTSRRRKRDVPNNTNDVALTSRLSLSAAIEPEIQVVPLNHTSDDDIIYHKIDVTNPPRIIYAAIAPCDNISLEIYIKLDGLPTPNDYNWTFRTFNNRSSDAQPQKIRLDIADLEGSSNVTVGVIAFTDLNETCYNLTIWSPQAQMWNEDQQQWSELQCDTDSNENEIVFKSNLFGSFGAGLSTAPNTIDFGSVFDDFGGKLLENAHVWATMLALLILSIPLFVLCRKHDKKDKLKWATLPLFDNFSEDQYKYEVHVYTGFKKNASTDSDINLEIIGTGGRSGTRILRDGLRKNFQKGDISSFVMQVPDDLGDPYCLVVSNENASSDRNADWFLAKMIIINPVTKEWYLFLCDKWFSAERDDRQTQRKLYIKSAGKADSSALLQQNMRLKMYEDHLWISIVYSRTRTNFTRVRKLACCLATLFLTMVTNAMWYNPSEDGAEVGVVLGPISISINEIYTSCMSSLVMFPPVLLITILFLRCGAKPENKKEEDGFKKRDKYKVDPEEQSSDREYKMAKATNDKKDPYWPWWCGIIAWVLVVLSVIVSAFFTLLYSFEFGPEKSKAWLTTFFLSFLQSLVLIQPLKVICFAMLMTFIWKKDGDLSEISTSLGSEKQPEQIDVQDEEIEDVGLQNTMSQNEIEYAKQKEETDSRMRVMVREVVYFVLLILLFAVVINGNQSPMVFWQNTDMRNVFLDSTRQIKTREDTWKWVEDKVIPALYFTEFYNGNQTMEDDEKYIANMMAMRLGPPRLRQLRVNNDSCLMKKQEKMEYFCMHQYSIANENTKDYNQSWSQNYIYESYDFHAMGPVEKAFIYQTEKELKGYPFWGALHHYSGGGYLANLGNTKQEAIELIQNLEAHAWIDLYTRAVFLEFNTLNMNTGLFNMMTVVIEMPSYGSIFKWQTVNSVNLYRYTGGAGVLALFAEIITALFILVVTIMEVWRMRKGVKTYITNIWKIALWLSLVMFYVALGLYVKRSIATEDAVEKMMNNPGESVNFQTVVTFDYYYLLMLGLAMFVTQLQLLHILRYSKTITLLLTTLKRVAPELQSFSLIGGIVFLAFCAAGAKLFTELADFKSLPSAFVYMTSAFMGKFDFQAITTEAGVTGGLFLLVYLIIMIFIVLNIFIVIINEYLDQTKSSPETLDNDHEVIEHFILLLKGFVGSNRQKEEPQVQTASTFPKLDQSFQELTDRIYILEALSDLYYE